jgi:cellulose synthase/poly-beta-1,6-N-acetylglucosamine synthase-like glycosyltransferase
VIFKVIFWLSAILLVYSYALYPALLAILSRFTSKRMDAIDPGEWPSVAVLLSAYNEESVIEAKIDSVFQMDYPRGKIKMIIGSDGSTDRTDQLIRQKIQEGLPILFNRYEGRNGKASVLNKLAIQAADVEIMLLTDANILFDSNLLKHLVRGFNQPKTGLVGAFVLHPDTPQNGIAKQESQYINRENRVKYLEGLLWGSMMGAFGACYAIRTKLFPKLPENFLMEDFYVSMHVLNAGYRVVAEPKATCFEDLPEEVTQEFRRKVRISTGNFQNLNAWKNLLWPPNPIAFTFWSHKILRWIGPIFLMLCWASSLYLAIHSPIYKYLFAIQTFLMFLPLMDKALGNIGIHIGPLRLIGYFYSMNLALLAGFIQYVKGVKTSAWQPTARNTPNV